MVKYFLQLENYYKPDGINIAIIKKLIKSKDSKADIDYILGEESEYDVGRHLANDFIKRTGFTKFPQALLNGIPLPSNQLNVDSFEEAVLSSVLQQTPMIQKAIYRGEISESDDVTDYLMNQPNVMPR